MIYHSRPIIKAFAFVLFMVSGIFLEAQQLIGVSSVEDEKYNEWTLMADIEANDGTLSRKWPMMKDNIDWSFRFGEWVGDFKPLNGLDPNEWKLTSNEGKMMTLRTQWKGDFSEWSITDNDRKIIFKAVNKKSLDHWVMSENKSKDKPCIELITLVEDDPRDWEIQDNACELDKNFKISMIFISVFFASQIAR